MKELFVTLSIGVVVGVIDVLPMVVTSVVLGPSIGIVGYFVL